MIQFTLDAHLSLISRVVVMQKHELCRRKCMRLQACRRNYQARIEYVCFSLPNGNKTSCVFVLI